MPQKQLEMDNWNMHISYSYHQMHSLMYVVKKLFISFCSCQAKIAAIEYKSKHFGMHISYWSFGMCFTSSDYLFGGQPKWFTGNYDTLPLGHTLKLSEQAHSERIRLCCNDSAIHLTGKCHDTCKSCLYTEYWSQQLRLSRIATETGGVPDLCEVTAANMLQILSPSQI